MIPYKADSTADLDCQMAKKVCTQGITKVMHIGKRRWQSLRVVTKAFGILPVHKNTGKSSLTVINEEQAILLKQHFEYLLELGKVYATRVLATLVDGEQGHANRDGTVDMVYLPTLFGFRPCYK